MKRGSTLFLRGVILLISTAALVGLLWFPQLEGRAANLDLLHIYMDPVILYSFIASTPFFIAMYNAFKLLGLVDQNKVFSQRAVETVRNIKYCAIAIPIFIILGDAFLVLNATSDDVTGPVALGIYMTFASIVIATATAVLQRVLQNAVDLKSENDLTV